MKSNVSTVLVVLAALLMPFVSSAQGVSLTITPTLFEMSAVPGQSWSTQIKVVNNNDFPITVYTSPVNFIPQGERGHSAFIPVLDETKTGQTLAEWMSVPTTSITIQPEQSFSVPITITVPTDAAPGGHYAAVMVGTRPPATDGVIAVKTSQLISSLFFLRIAGDVHEDAMIREFLPAKRFVSIPEQTLILRFENTGNVHLRPEGRIVITNMWGKERGIIPVNHQTNFGNVLPESIRKYEFTWAGENALTDFGRYTATLTLGFGAEQRQFVSRSTHFWIVPVRPLATAIAVFLFAIWFIRRTIKAYVRYMLRLSGIDPDAPVYQNASTSRAPLQGDVRITRRAIVKAPVKAGVHDLRTRLKDATAFIDTARALISFVISYRIFFVSLTIIVSLIALLVWYVQSVTTDTRDYEIRVEGASGTTLISSETQYQTESQRLTNPNNDSYILTVTNASNQPGAAAAVADTLARLNYRVDEVTAELDVERDATVLIYPPALSEEAKRLSEALGDVAISVFAGSVADDGTPRITVLVGNE